MKCIGVEGNKIRLSRKALARDDKKGKSNDGGETGEERVERREPRGERREARGRGER